MAQTKTGTTGITDQFQGYFSRKLLATLKENLILAPFGAKSEVPKGNDKTITWFRFGAAATTDIAALTEGTPLAAYRTLALDKVTATLTQYGQIIQLTDVLQATELFNHMKAATVTNGMDAALHAEEIIRNELGSDMTGGTYIGDRTKRLAQGAANYAAVDTATDKSTVSLTALDVLDAVTNLKINKAVEQPGGGFVGMSGHAVLRDLMNDGDWIDAAKYGDVNRIFNGEVGKIHGCRFLGSTVPFRSVSTQYTYNVAGDVYSTFILGQQAFGVPNIPAMSAMSPKVYVVTGADKGDPLDQQTDIGFKTFYTAKGLTTEAICEIYSGTSYA